MSEIDRKAVDEVYRLFVENFIKNLDTFFVSIEILMRKENERIKEEFLDWQKNGGQIRDFEIIEKEYEVLPGFHKTLLIIKIPELKRCFCMSIDSLYIDKEIYKKGLQAVFSFALDRPQYLKFIDMKGFFNPLRLLLGEFIYIKYGKGNCKRSDELQE